MSDIQYRRIHGWVVGGWYIETMAEIRIRYRLETRQKNKRKLLCFNCINADAESDHIHCRSKGDMVYRVGDGINFCIWYRRGEPRWDDYW